MESHFRNVLKSSTVGDAHDSFIAASKFEGRKEGYCFRNGERGIGYYLDKAQIKQLDTAVQKRKLEEERRSATNDEDDEDEDPQPMKKKAVSGKLDIQQLLDEADNKEITQLTPDSLRLILSNLEKKISKNQKMRMKFADEPEKFMDSELDLHQQIEDLHLLATSPELYHILLESETHGLQNIVNLISHDNTDVSLATVSFLQELFDVELEEIQENLSNLKDVYLTLETFIQLQGMEILIQNLSRLKDQESDEDAQGVYHTFQIIESIFDISSLASFLTTATAQSSSSKNSSSNSKKWMTSAEIAAWLCSKTNILFFVLSSLQQKTFIMNKYSCSELLTILLQSHESVPLYLLHMSTSSGKSLFTKQSEVSKLYGQEIATTAEKKQDYFVIPTQPNEINGLELLMQAIAIYRKREIVIPEEQECVENLFLSLKTILLSHTIFQTYFLFEYEGLELMLQCIQNKQYAYHNAFHAINYALLYIPLAGHYLIQKFGLKYIFPHLLSLQSTLHPTFQNEEHKKKAKKVSLEKQEKDQQLEESLISILSQLITQSFLLHQQTDFFHSKAPKNLKHATKEELRDNFPRIFSKLMEHHAEKFLYLVQLFGAYQQKLYAYDKTLQESIRSLERILSQDPENEEAFDEYELLQDSEYVEQQRSEGGLYMLQQLVIIICGVLSADIILHPDVSVTASSVWSTTAKALLKEDSEVDDVLQSLRDTIVKLKEPSEDNSVDHTTSRSMMEELYRKAFVQWSALFTTKLSE